LIGVKPVRYPWVWRWLDFIDAAFGTDRLDVEIGEVRVLPSSALAGKILRDSMIPRQAGAIVLGLKPADGALLFNPAPETVISLGDHLIVIGGDARLRKLESLASPQTHT
jgi:voltage-gated potassium channel